MYLFDKMCAEWCRDKDDMTVLCGQTKATASATERVLANIALHAALLPSGRCFEATFEMAIMLKQDSSLNFHEIVG